MWFITMVIIALSLADTTHAMCTINSCVNGYCTSSSVCKCFNGFTKDPYGRCVSFDPCTAANCQNGFCSPITFVCTCKDGYIMGSNGNCLLSGACTLDSCKNGFCSDGGNCYCRNGFFKDPNGACTAVARCVSTACINGECDPLTQECKCKPGYTKTTSGQCVGFGTCSLSCQNGQCAKLISMVEVCYCNQGFTRDPNQANKCIKPASGGSGAGEQEVELEELGAGKTQTTTADYANQVHNQQTPSTTPLTIPFKSETTYGGSGSKHLWPINERLLTMFLRLLSLRRLIDALS